MTERMIDVHDAGERVSAISVAPPTEIALTPVNFLARSAVVHADRIAVIDGDRRITYRQWWDRVRAMAGFLVARGIRQGDKVAVLSPNSLMTLDAHYGVALAGAVLVTLNTRVTAADLDYIVEHSGASLLLYDESLFELAEQLTIGVKVDSASYEAALVSADQMAIEITDERSLIAINYTSGTTGRPKGVMYHHRGAYLQAMAMAFHGQLGTNTRYLWTLPLFHCNGWSFVWAVTAAGGTHVCLDKVVPDRIWELIDDEDINIFNAAPTVLNDLAASNRRHPLAASVRVGTGGAPPSPALLEKLGALGFSVTHLYGATETFGPSVIGEFPPELNDAPIEVQTDFKARQGNCNVVGVPVRIVDSTGREVPADGMTMGEVQIRGNTVSVGYHGDEKATAEAFGSGWFATGDLGVMHPDNMVELRDRSKDIIISGGENIASIEVEQALSRCPGVSEVAVVAAPHARWGEVPVAYVSVINGAELAAEDVIAFARTQLPGFKVPKSIVFGALPKTATGKIQKFLLRAAVGDRG